MVFYLDIYKIALGLYRIAIRLAALFNRKAAIWRASRLKQAKNPWIYQGSEPLIWFHSASTGEFEQAKPLIQAWKRKYPHHFILATFFSPSGFEAKSKDACIDQALYLPLDHPLNSHEFIQQIKPSKVFFVKYEFWYYYFKTLHDQKIPLYIVSAHFQPKQVFFQPLIGPFFKKILSFVDTIFVQTADSKKLLEDVGIKSVVSGDTRLQRVKSIKNQDFTNATIASFCQDQKICIAGSIWPQDENLLDALIKQRPQDKWIIVPHEISAQKTRAWAQKYQGIGLVYSLALADQDFSKHQLLYIDQMGMLAFIYRYARLAYIGGGFGKGIHNTLEAAVYEIPVIFGPKYQRFAEAYVLINQGIGFTVQNTKDFAQIMRHLDQQEKYLQVQKQAKQFFLQAPDATEVIMRELA